MARFSRSGLPDVDALIEVHEAEQGKLEEAIVVTAAESTVTSIRRDDLVEQQRAAQRRMSAAKGLLTKAQKDGDAARIVAARDRYDRAYAEFDAISHEGIAELQQLSQAGLDNLGEVLAQTCRAWDPGAAVIESLAGPPPPRTQPPTTGGPA